MVGHANASSDHFDIYGVSPEVQKQIYSLCKDDIEEYVRLSDKIKPSSKLTKMVIKRHEVELSLVKKVQTLGDFSLVHLSTVNYQGTMGTYTTLDIVQKADSSRLPKSPIRSDIKTIKKPEELKQVFHVWADYVSQFLVVLSQKNVDMKSRSCPVVHCVYGFDKNQETHMLPQLKIGASKYKNQLIDLIKYSADDEERGDAIFILANTTDYHEIAQLMMQLTNDSSETVRNNSMRVLGAIMAKYELPDLDKHSILLALNYPYVTDRNKASYVLLDIVRHDKASHSMVLRESGDTLINLLKLKQPNNHDIAYLILKEISHKNYAEHDYKHWQQWLDLEKKS
jgi:hypothetical protein